MTKMVQTYNCIAEKLKDCFCRNQCGNMVRPLSQLDRAGKVRICKVNGDRQLCARMAAMGLYPGTEAELICPENGSQCILKIHGGKVCLDRTISENILVAGR